MERECSDSAPDPAYSPVSGLKELVKRLARGLGLAFAIVFALSYFVVHDDYGITWDESENFHIGERNYYFWRTLDFRYLDENQTALPGFESIFWNDQQPWRYPPFANTLSALTGDLLHHRWGFMRLVPAHHAAIFLFMVPLLWLAYAEGNRLFGFPAGLVGVVLIAFHPRFLHHSHSNIKDIPMACLFGITVLSVLRGLCLSRARWIVASGMVFGVALATKVNAFFLPLVVVPALVEYHAGLMKRREGPSARMSLAMVLWPVLALAVFVLLWPYLWKNPAYRLGRYFQYCGSYGFAALPPSWKLGPLAWVAWTTPLPYLAAGGMGLVYTAWRRWRGEGREALLLALWLFVPLGRSCLPNVPQVDGVRRYIEFIPALAILAGAGTVAVLRVCGAVLEPKVWAQSRAVMAALLVLLPALHLAVVDVQLAPFQIAYFNCLVGGPAGARARGIQPSGDYYGSCCRQMAPWLNKTVEPNADVSILLGEHMFRLEGLLRPDIQTHVRFPAGYERGYVVFLYREGFLDERMRYFDANVRPLHVLEAGGVPLVKVYRVTPELLEPYCFHFGLER